MGLDVMAYETVEHLPNETQESCEAKWKERVVWLYPNPGFGDRADGLVEGAYKASGEVVDAFSAAYSYYNRWRAQLARIMGTTDREVWDERAHESVRSMPFYELIDFSDCEGVIGPKTSAKLAADFIVHREKAVTIGGDFLRHYDNFAKAFVTAAKGGVVQFS